MEEQRPFAFYFLMVFLTVGVSFIGFNFGGVAGAIVGFICSAIVNYYALQIKLD